MAYFQRSGFKQPRPAQSLSAQPAPPTAVAEQDRAPSASTEAPPLRLLSIAEVGALFNRNERSLRRWEKAGHLIPVRVGRSLFYRREDVERLITQRMTDAALARMDGREGPAA